MKLKVAERTQSATAGATHVPGDELDEREAFAIGFQAYLWGYVYVKSMLLKEEATHPAYHGYAPVNCLRCHESLAKPGFTDFTPNVDVLMGLGWLDLSQGPVLLHVPAVSDRYWSVQVTDYALNSAEYVGSRMNSGAGVYAYVHRNWKGRLPPGVKRIDVSTDIAMIQLRTLVRPEVPGDVERGVRINKKFKLEVLNKKAMFTATLADAVLRSPKPAAPAFHSIEFFALLNEAVTKSDVLPGEEFVLAQFSSVGIGKGLTFSPESLKPAQRRGLQAGLEAGFKRLTVHLSKSAERLGDWNFNYRLGQYGTDYVTRSLTACFGYGPVEPCEALYAYVLNDGSGEPLLGTNRYRMRFGKGAMPPADAFWSITIYSRPDNQLVSNSIDRYSISSMTAGLDTGRDGSLEVFIQEQKPRGIKARNWLPAPQGNFWLILRIYIPQKSVLDRKYIPPNVVRVSA